MYDSILLLVLSLMVFLLACLNEHVEHRTDRKLPDRLVNFTCLFTVTLAGLLVFGVIE